MTAQYDKEFSKLTRQHFDQVQKRLNNMTDEEIIACKKFLMPGLMQRYRTYRQNALVKVSDVEIQINACVKMYRDDNRQNSQEYKDELERKVAADRAKKRYEREQWAKQEAERRNNESIAKESESKEMSLDEAFEDTVKEVLIEKIDEAIQFHVTKTKSYRNIRQWRQIKEAILSGYASNALKSQVSRSAGNARKGGRYYDLWRAVHNMIRDL